MVARISRWLLDYWKFVQLREYTILLAVIHGYRPKSKETDAKYLWILSTELVPWHRSGG